MKSLNEAHPSYWREWLTIWREIYEKIDTLLHYQLIICPYSSIHEDESILANKTHTQAYKALESMYQHLGHWKHFTHTEEIERMQYYNAFKRYLRDKIDLPDWSIERHMDEFHEWSETIFISVKSGFLEWMMDELDSEKDQIHSAIGDVYDNVWIKEKRTYDELFDLEMRAHGRSIYMWYAKSLDDLDKAQKWLVSVESVMWSILWKEWWIFHLFTDLLTRAWITGAIDQIGEIVKFLYKSDLSIAPFINIQSALWAGIAELAYKNQLSKKQVNAGMSKDVTAVAHYLPYCDAMLVDWVVQRVMEYKPVKEKIGHYKSEIFSWKSNSLNAFSEYLDSIYLNMTPVHKEVAERAYGNEFKPYTTLYRDKN
jgi:hypothetical protein